jgi:hypothetical protein
MIIKLIVKKLKKICGRSYGIDLVGYESLIHIIRKYKLYNLEGDFCEIGAFVGGGTKKLAKFAKKYNKKVIAVDIFDYKFDDTINTENRKMSWIYKNYLAGTDQYEIYLKNIDKYKDQVIIYKMDSAELNLKNKLCFTFIDGCHAYDYVINDFNKAFEKTVKGGVIGFHDYAYDLPDVTKAIHEIIYKNSKIIKIIQSNTSNHTIFIMKLVD